MHGYLKVTEDASVKTLCSILEGIFGRVADFSAAEISDNFIAFVADKVRVSIERSQMALGPTQAKFVFKIGIAISESNRYYYQVEEIRNTLGQHPLVCPYTLYNIYRKLHNAIRLERRASEKLAAEKSLLELSTALS